MADDVRYEARKEADREAAAAYLRKVADRLAAGKQVLPADSGDGRLLVAPDSIGIDLQASGGDHVRVDIGLEWTPDVSSDQTDEAETEQTDSGDGDAHQSTGWASAGASSGYSLPSVDGLDDADDEFERAAYFLRKGKTEAALNRFENAVERAPRDARRRYHVATVCWKTGHPDRATEHFEAAAALAAEDPTIQLEYASYLWSQGRTEQARDVYERVLEVAPESADVHSALGRFRWETENDPKAAADHLKQALDIDEDHALSHLNYAVLLRHGGKHDRAEQHFEQAIEHRESDPIVQTEYGHFLWERGEVEEAARRYARAE